VPSCSISPEAMEPFDPRPDGLVVGEGATQPALVDVEHAAALGLFLDGLLGLLLGAHKKNRPALGDRVAHERVGLLHHPDGLLQVDNVDAVPLSEDERLHLGIPAAGLMAKVHS